MLSKKILMAALKKIIADSKEYQGYSNKNTWRVAVRIGNYEPLYKAALSLKKTKPNFKEKDVLTLLKPFYKYSDLEEGDGEIDLKEISEMIKEL